MPRADRDRSGQRNYDASVLSWIEFLNRLKTMGMAIGDMRRYAALRQLGDHTREARRKLLEAHRDKVRSRVAELKACLLVLDDKIAGYAGAEERMKTHERTAFGP